MTPAAAASAVAYTHYLHATGLPIAEAHRAFEDALDGPLEPQQPGEMTEAEKRAVLTAGIRARGEDVTGRIEVTP